MKKRLLSLVIAFMMTVSVCAGAVGCSSEKNDIFILFTHDVHCGIDENIGYAGLATYKKETEKLSPYVALVDSGDFSQGNFFGSVSKGKCLIEIMNEVGYDYAALGNHEFDYGTDVLAENIEALSATVLCCNADYNGKGENPLKNVKPYEIKNFGGVKVGFVGVTTPRILTSTSPAVFLEDGEMVFDFCIGDDGARIYSRVQETVDACRKDGADYVLLMAHLGVDEIDSPYTSTDVIAHTSGIDAVLDAHSHTELPGSIRKDKDGKTVVLVSTGTKLSNIGQVVITAGGAVIGGYIDEYEKMDPDISAKINAIKDKYEKGEMSKVIAHLPFSLPAYDENGIRMVRNSATAIGDLIADAFRKSGGSDIGMVNGGGIRASLPAGDVTYKNMMDVSPYGNLLCTAKIKGSTLLDMFEYFYRSTEASYVKDGKAVGEEGSFQSISGMKLTIDTSVPTSIKTDEDDMLISVGETRRVKDVQILKNGEYVPLDPEETYTVTASEYMLKNGGSGMQHFLGSVEIVTDSAKADYEALADYIVSLNGDFAQYAAPQGRITIK